MATHGERRDGPHGVVRAAPRADLDAVPRADLDVDRVTVEFTSGEYTVRPLRDFSMRGADGQLLVVHGPSGGGKTTLLSVLAGLLTPTSGRVTFGGRSITDQRGTDRTEHRRHNVGVIFQAFNLVPSLTAAENVMAPLTLTGMRSRPARRRAEELLDRVGLADRRGHRPGRLSGGQQQRVAIARALVHDPPLIVADEPTAHLDHIQVEVVLTLLRELAQPGRLVVVATHDDRFSRIADEVVEVGTTAPAAERPPVRVHLQAGETLFEQGDPGDQIFVVEDGAIQVARTLTDGSERVLKVFTPGEWFGEIAALTGLPRTGSARALQPTVVTAHGVHEFRRRTAGAR